MICSPSNTAGLAMSKRQNISSPAHLCVNCHQSFLVIISRLPADIYCVKIPNIPPKDVQNFIFPLQLLNLLPLPTDFHPQVQLLCITENKRVNVSDSTDCATFALSLRRIYHVDRGWQILSWRWYILTTLEIQHVFTQHVMLTCGLRGGKTTSWEEPQGKL